MESVAWVAERKDTLSGFFFMLTLAAYVRHVRRPASRLWYWLMIFAFALGLMSKPMLVTLPFLLLLLDYWPLRRISNFKFQISDLSRLLIEKIPLLVLSLASAILTVLAQGTAIQPVKEFPWPVRLDNAVVSAVTYVWQTFCPVRLAVFYPFPAGRRWRSSFRPSCSWSPLPWRSSFGGANTPFC